LFDNEKNKSTGGQNTYQNYLDYVHFAKSTGFNTYDKVIFSVEDFKAIIKNVNG